MAETEAPAAAAAAAEQTHEASGRERNSNRIQVSSSKKPMYFYVTLAKRLLGEHGDVHLSALGMAVSTMVSVAEILKKDGVAVETRLSTCMDLLGGDGRYRPVQKPKMEVWLKKSDNFDAIIAAEQENGGGAGAAAGEEHEEDEEEEAHDEGGEDS